MGVGNANFFEKNLNSKKTSKHRKIHGINYFIYGRRIGQPLQGLAASCRGKSGRRRAGYRGSAGPARARKAPQREDRSSPRPFFGAGREVKGWGKSPPSRFSGAGKPYPAQGQAWGDPLAGRGRLRSQTIPPGRPLNARSDSGQTNGCLSPAPQGRRERQNPAYRSCVHLLTRIFRIRKKIIGFNVKSNFNA